MDGRSEASLARRIGAVLAAVLLVELAAGLLLTRGEDVLRARRAPEATRRERAAALHRLLGRGLLDEAERAALLRSVETDPELARFLERSFPRIGRARPPGGG